VVCRIPSTPPVQCQVTTTMEERPSVVERAFQIARSGRVANIIELRELLTAEGYPNSAQSLAGRPISSQLTRMITEARANYGLPG
jgi:hypothetical protein